MDPLPPTLDLRSSLILNRGEPSRACWIVEQGAVCPDLLASLLTLATPPPPPSPEGACFLHQSVEG